MKTNPNDFVNSKFSYYFLSILLFLSITSGYFLSDIFLGLGSDFFSQAIFINPLQNQLFLEKHFEVFFFKWIPLFISALFFFFFNKLNFKLKQKKYIYYFFKLKIYFDFVVNFFVFFIYKYSYLVFFKQIDKSFLEILGPFGIIRFFFFLSFNLNKLNMGILFNYVCLFFFFFSFSLLF